MDSMNIIAALQISIKFEKSNLIRRLEEYKQEIKLTNREASIYAYIVGKISEIERTIEFCERLEKGFLGMKE